MPKEKKDDDVKKEMGLYEKLASRSKELIEETKVKSEEALHAAIDRAKQEMVAAGDFSHEKGEKLKSFLLRDLRVTQEYFLRVGQATKELINPQRLSSGIQGTLANILTAFGNKLEDWGSKIESHLEYRTGEIASIGQLKCKRCGNEIKMHVTGHVPPCPQCRGTEFIKS